MAQVSLDHGFQGCFLLLVSTADRWVEACATFPFWILKREKRSWQRGKSWALSKRGAEHDVGSAIALLDFGSYSKAVEHPNNLEGV